MKEKIRGRERKCERQTDRQTDKKGSMNRPAVYILFHVIADFFLLILKDISALCGHEAVTKLNWNMHLSFRFFFSVFIILRKFDRICRPCSLCPM